MQMYIIMCARDVTILHCI